MHTLDIEASLTDPIKEGGHDINSIKPYIVAERTPEQQQKFAVFGKVVEAVKQANKDKMGREVVVEP
eukprot:9049063-Karenia_brevis.AAC.1